MTLACRAHPSSAMSTSTATFPSRCMVRRGSQKVRTGKGDRTFDFVQSSIRRGSDLNGSGGRLLFFSQRAICCLSRRRKACPMCSAMGSSLLAQLCAPAASARHAKTGTWRVLIASPFTPPTLDSIWQRKAQRSGPASAPPGTSLVKEPEPPPSKGLTAPYDAHIVTSLKRLVKRLRRARSEEDQKAFPREEQGFHGRKRL